MHTHGSDLLRWYLARDVPPPLVAGVRSRGGDSVAAVRNHTHIRGRGVWRARVGVGRAPRGAGLPAAGRRAAPRHRPRPRRPRRPHRLRAAPPLRASVPAGAARGAAAAGRAAAAARAAARRRSPAPAPAPALPGLVRGVAGPARARYFPSVYITDCGRASESSGRVPNFEIETRTRVSPREKDRSLILFARIDPFGRDRGRPAVRRPFRARGPLGSRENFNSEASTVDRSVLFYFVFILYRLESTNRNGPPFRNILNVRVNRGEASPGPSVDGSEIAFFMCRGALGRLAGAGGVPRRVGVRGGRGAGRGARVVGGGGRGGRGAGPPRGRVRARAAGAGAAALRAARARPARAPPGGRRGAGRPGGGGAPRGAAPRVPARVPAGAAARHRHAAPALRQHRLDPHLHRLPGTSSVSTVYRRASPSRPDPPRCPQNGTLMAALEAWRNAAGAAAAGAACCVCYSRLHAASGHAPNVLCRQCRNRFHTPCLVMYRPRSIVSRSTSRWLPVLRAKKAAQRCDRLAAPSDISLCEPNIANWSNSSAQVVPDKQSLQLPAVQILILALEPGTVDREPMWLLRSLA
ncbi:unnamed protein product [Diatraea saccharalis]|uniref:Uncharacterized protein n=1 Tax=Diatraea saccharalis TaxID=40085 RepID=A0A9N9REP3_9NEOP|nr:unnamed protein product [Diatraea saccharalis]